MCLRKSVEVIRQEGEDGDVLEYPDNFCQLVNHVGDDWHLSGIKVCLEQPKEVFWIFESYRDSAILGLQAYHIDENGEVLEHNPIGNMDCDEEDMFEYREVNGENVGEIKMGFEGDGEGIAIKFRDRSEEVIEKTGDRKSAELKTFTIPDDEELVGFHGA